jgi:hypothetical protein
MNATETGSQDDQSNEQSSTTLPIWSKKYWTGSGSIEIAVWSRIDDNNREQLSCSFKKSFKEKKKFRDSNTFFPQELLIAALAMQEAAMFCFNHQNKK